MKKKIKSTKICIIIIIRNSRKIRRIKKNREEQPEIVVKLNFDWKDLDWEFEKKLISIWIDWIILSMTGVSCKLGKTIDINLRGILSKIIINERKVRK